MRRITTVCFVAFLVVGFGVPAFPVGAQSSISAGMGVHFFQYDQTYLTVMNAAYLHELGEGLELNIGGEFAIDTYDDEGNTEARFLIPANLGLNFTFPREPATFVFGTGLTPVFNINPDKDTDMRFFMGPYVKGSVRLRVHPIMSWFVEAQQDLLIGGDDWINTATRLTTGINFTLGASSD